MTAKLLAEPDNPMSWFLGVVSKMGITPTESATIGPPEQLMTTKERARLLLRAIELREAALN